MSGVRQEVEGQDGVVSDVEYAADVTVRALLPEEHVEKFTSRLTELAAGGLSVTVSGERFRGVPKKNCE